MPRFRLRKLGNSGACCLALLIGATLTAAQGHAQTPGATGPDSVAGDNPPAVELLVGVVDGALPIGNQLAWTVVVQRTTRSENGTGGFVIGLGYAREFTEYGSCCGPNPGFTYQEEALHLAFGPEITVLRRPGGQLAVDARFQPTAYHTMRHGSQEDFQPSPTRWHWTPWVGSVGATGRRPLSPSLHGSAGVRLHFDAAGALLGATPRPALALMAGVAW